MSVHFKKSDFNGVALPPQYQPPARESHKDYYAVIAYRSSKLSDCLATTTFLKFAAINLDLQGKTLDAEQVTARRLPHALNMTREMKRTGRVVVGSYSHDVAKTKLAEMRVYLAKNESDIRGYIPLGVVAL